MWITFLPERNHLKIPIHWRVFCTTSTIISNNLTKRSWRMETLHMLHKRLHLCRERHHHILTRDVPVRKDRWNYLWEDIESIESIKDRLYDSLYCSDRQDLRDWLILDHLSPFRSDIRRLRVSIFPKLHRNTLSYFVKTGKCHFKTNPVQLRGVESSLKK